MPSGRARSLEPIFYVPLRFHLDKRLQQIITSEPDPNSPGDQKLTQKAVAGWLGVSEQWLINGRIRGYGPDFTDDVLTPYRRADVRRWLKQRIQIVGA